MGFWNALRTVGSVAANVYSFTPLPFAGIVGKAAQVLEGLGDEEEEEEEEDGSEEEE